MNKYPTRLIEVDLPIARISAHARREKSIRHGHISTLHIWWARRPLAACRAVICAALWPDPADPLCPQSFRDAAAEQLMAFARRVFPERITAEKKQLQQTASPESLARWESFVSSGIKLDPTDAEHQNVLRYALLDFIADFANWDNSTVPAYLETSRVLTQAAHEALGGAPGTRPLVVDPFAGGGSIPLEALRVGADAFASDLNPVAVLLNKVVLEYIPEFGSADIRMEDAHGREAVFQGLAEAVRYWGGWIGTQVEKELSHLYPKDPDGSMPIAYLWARTVLNEAPGQGQIPTEVPLLRSLWLLKKRNRKLALRWVRDDHGIVQTATEEVTYADGSARVVRRPLLEVFEPKRENEVECSTVARGSVTCPVTGYTMSVETVRQQLMQRKGGSTDGRILAVLVRDTSNNELFRAPIPADLSAVELAGEKLRTKSRETSTHLGFTPDEAICRNEIRRISLPIYGMNTWDALFVTSQ